MSAPAMDRMLISGFEPVADGLVIRDKAAALLAGASLPTYRDEEYKYTPLTALAETNWVSAPKSTLDATGWLDEFLPSVEQHRIVFVNGHYDEGLSSHSGIEFLQLCSDQPKELGSLACAEPTEFRVAAHLGRLEKPAMPLTAAINTVSFADGACVRISSKVEKPIHIIYASTGTSVAVAPRTLIIAEPGAEATIIETYLSDGETLVLPVTEVIVHSNAKLEHIRLCNESLQARHLSLTEVRQERDSTYQSYNVVFGGALVRNDINLFIAGSNAHTRFDGVVAIDGDQHVDNHTRLDHAEPHCESFEIYKHLLGGKSRAVFNGKIFVHQDAQKTDAKQTNMTLLLSPTAQVDTKPQLEIFADDVKCTHGATIGQLRKDALFYLRSRGIDEATARGLLVYAFAAEVMELIENEQLCKALESMLLAKLSSK
ncbi:MAG: Fe-S cluster assembly protein SufD [Chthonomonas sp.]|nr:Fe-S cluster assembly protein SufD [Chthonomonas sp.]